MSRKRTFAVVIGPDGTVVVVDSMPFVARGVEPSGWLFGQVPVFKLPRMTGKLGTDRGRPQSGLACG